MNKLKYILISIPFYLIAVFSIVVYLITDIHPRVVISPEGRLVLLGIFCIFLYIGSHIICKVPAININKIMKTTFFIFFMLYLSLLLTFTLFDPMFGRNGTVNFILSDKMLLKNYLANSFNIIPFATVIEYVKALLAQSMNLSTIVTNLFGNLIALAPMALFLPMFIKKCENFKHFIIFTAGIVVLIELLQLIFVTGSCDIDDLILNVVGASITFILLRTKLIGKFIKILIPSILK